MYSLPCFIYINNALPIINKIKLNILLISLILDNAFLDVIFLSNLVIFIALPKMHNIEESVEFNNSKVN